MAESVPNYSYYTELEVPADLYGTDATLSVVGSANLLIAPADMDVELVFKIAESIYNNKGALIAENALATKIVP